MWYVVQVRTGTEKEIITQCEKKIDHGILKRCFVPYYEARYTIMTTFPFKRDKATI